MIRPTGRFSRRSRLRHARDFQRVSRSGRRAASEAYVVLVAKAEGVRSPRLGLTVSRKVGNAVVRNRVKRQVREWFRASRDQLEGAWDVVVIARRRASELESAESGPELSRLLRAATT